MSQKINQLFKKSIDVKNHCIKNGLDCLRIMGDFACESIINEGKFSATVGETVMIPFTSNDSGEIAILFYAVTSVDGWIDNVKVY